MIQLNEKKLDFSAILIVEGKPKKLFKPLDREIFIEKIEEISDLTVKYEAMQTLICLIDGKKVEVKDGEINLYYSQLVYRLACTITNNPELVSLLEELVR